MVAEKMDYKKMVLRCAIYCFIIALFLVFLPNSHMAETLSSIILGGFALLLVVALVLYRKWYYPIGLVLLALVSLILPMIG